jgi:plasmid stabilization system protein ParE
MFSVRLAEPAERDADEIIAWIAEHSTDGAKRWWEALQVALTRLQRNPTGLARAPESNFFSEAVYQILFRTRRGRTYRALYIVRGNIVHVLRIRGPRQNLVTESDIELPGA